MLNSTKVQDDELDVEIDELVEDDLDAMADTIYNNEFIRDWIIRRHFSDMGKTRCEKPKPKEPPPAQTDKHKFCPMVPPTLILNRRINGEAKTLYCWMLMQSKGNTLCHASQVLMAKELGWSVKKVQRCIDMLEAQQFVETVEDVDGRSQDAYGLLVLPPRQPKTEK